MSHDGGRKEGGNWLQGSRTTGSVIIGLKAAMCAQVDLANGILSTGYSPELTISDSGDKHASVFNTPDWWVRNRNASLIGAFLADMSLTLLIHQSLFEIVLKTRTFDVELI